MSVSCGPASWRVRSWLSVLLLLAGAVPGLASAAVQVSGAASVATGGGFVTTVVVAHTVPAGANRYLLVGVSTSAVLGGGPATAAVWNNGAVNQNLALLGTASQGNQHTAIFGLVAPNTGGPGTVTVTVVGFIPVATIGAVNLIGVDQTTPGGNFFAATGNSTTPNVTVCPNAPTGCNVDSGDLVLATLATTIGAGAVTVNAIAPALMTFDAASGSNALTSASLSWSHAIGSANVRKLVVGVAVEADNSATANNCASPGNADVTNVTYNAQALTHVAGADACIQSANGFMQRVELWYQDAADLPIAGSYTVLATLAGSVNEIKGGAASLDDAAAGAPEAVATGTVDGTTNTITTNVALGTANAWLLDWVGAGDAGTFTPGGGQIERLDINGTSASAAMSTKANITAAANSMAQTHSAAGVNRLAHGVLRIAPHCPAGGCATGTLWDATVGGGFVNSHGVGFAHGGAGATTMSATMANAAPWALGAVLLKKVSTITQAVVDGVRAWSRGSGALVEWETLAEHRTLGFHLQRLNPQTGEFERLNKRLLPGLLHSRNGGIYRFYDRDAVVGETYAYRIVEVENTGKRNTYGPYQILIDSFSGHVEAGAASDRPTEQFERVVRRTSKASKQRRARHRAARGIAERQRAQRRGAVAKIGVKDAGLYRLNAETIADTMGLSVSRVRDLIRRGGLALSTGAEQVATMNAADGASLLFYAQAIESQYTEHNIYQLRAARGLPMGRIDGAPAAPGPVQSFPYTQHVEGNRFTLTHLFDDPDGDYWMWDFRIGGLQFDDCASVVPPAPCNITDFPLATPDIDRRSAVEAELLVRLHGASDPEGTSDHHVTVSLNGNALETVVFDGLRPFDARFRVPLGELLDDNNTVQVVVQAPADPLQMSVVYVNDITLRYSRLQVARTGMLDVATAARPSITIGGFDTAAVLLLDVSDGRRPKVFEHALVDRDALGYRITATPGQATTRVLAVEPARALSVNTIIADVPSRLRRRGNRADWLLISSDDLQAAGEELAAHRRAQGLRTMVVDVEDVYDEFNHGIRSAEAIWRFLRHAHTRWLVAPRYVALAGEGSHDYKNYLGFGDSLIPTLLAPTPAGLFPSDNLYADVVGNDWLPEMAIGRLPVIDGAEFAQVVRKIVAYERNTDIDGWGRRVVVSADASELGADFTGDSIDLQDLVPVEYAVNRVHVDDLGPSSARSRMLANLADGSAYLNFYGHSGHLSIGNFSPGMLTADDVATLHNGLRLPVVTAFTCLAGQFGFPGQESVGEQLIVTADGGAAAIWSPSGLSEHAMARMLGEAFYAQAFGNGPRRVGDTIMDAQRQYVDRIEDRYLLDIYNLIGDPATLVK